MNFRRPHSVPFLSALLALASLAFPAPAEEPPVSSPSDPATHSVTGNPAAVDLTPGTGQIGQLVLPKDSPLRIGGLWLADTNGLLSGGAEPHRWSFNSALIIGANLDAEKLIGWKGASFGAQFLRFDGQDTNGQAGSVQGYNSLPGPSPRDRSELYELWYRQSLFDDRLIIRIGKQVPTFDFNNVALPVVTGDELLDVPSVTGLLYTPVFVNPTLLGAIGGYYNSVTGICLSVAPTRNSYLRYGVYDGNVANGSQTGLTGPDFNGYVFNIWEGGVQWVLADKYPGQFGMGGWYQTGALSGPNGIIQDGTGGFYLFGSQRIWSNDDRSAGHRGGDESKSLTARGPRRQPASISTFLQYGINNSETMPMDQYLGGGFTGFGLVPGRPSDSMGVGVSWACLNPHLFQRSSELMFQTYYQAHVFGATYFQPAVTYIPTPGADPKIDQTWALTLRVTTLF